MVRIETARVASYPILEVWFTDGHHRRYDLAVLTAPRPDVAAMLASGQLPAQPTILDYGFGLQWADEFELDAILLRFYADDLDLHEWKFVPTATPLHERVALAQSAKAA